MFEFTLMTSDLAEYFKEKLFVLSMNYEYLWAQQLAHGRRE
jgi:hypothetical protein